MKRVLVALMIVAVLPDMSAAQQTSGRIAFDYCYSYQDLTTGDYVHACTVYAFNPGGAWVFVGFGFDPAMSPDGTRVAYVAQYQHSPSLFEPSDILVIDLRGGPIINLTAGDGALGPAWSRDGRRIAFESSRSGTAELYVVNVDGTGLRQVTNGVGFRRHPTWSPDDRIAFECDGQRGWQNLCSINSDGTGFRRLTDFDADDREPAFSPDGARLAFLRARFGSPTLEIMDAAGTVTSLGVFGNTPAWSPDGTQLVFSVPWEGACNADGGPCGGYSNLFLMNLDDGSVTLLTSGANPSWSDSPPGGFRPTAVISIACTLLTCTFDASLSSDDGAIVSYAWRFDDGMTATGTSVVRTYPGSGSHTVELVVLDDYGLSGMSTRAFDVTDSLPVASFTHECSGLTCRFDASGSSDSDGRVVSYAWSFGDGTSASLSEAVVTHSYPPGTYVVRLTVVDNARATGSASAEIVAVNRPPVASFQFSCDALAPVCVFNATGSDPDGNNVTFAWNFGDGTTGIGQYLTHTYQAAGTYTVTLTAADNYGATTTRTASVTVARFVVHVGDLDGFAEVQKKYWFARVDISVHDAAHLPISTRVDGVWSNGESGSCTVGSSGLCTVNTVLPTSRNSVTFTVQNISYGSAIYDAALNHDVDGETNGTTITVTRR